MATYRLSGAVSLARWDLEYVVYHHLSGDTHFVSDEFSYLFAFCVNRQAITESKLIKECQQLDLEKSELIELVNRFVERLTHLNILEVVASESK